MDTPLALVGSMIAMVIGVLSSATTPTLPPVIPLPVAIQPAAQPMPAPTHPPTATSPPHPQAMIHVSDSQDNAQLRDWKKRNAESMKILDKTTKEMPLH